MKLYADLPTRRARQVVADGFLVVWVVASLLLAQAVHRATLALAAPGRELEEAGSGLADRLREIGSAVDGTPLVGEELEAPFSGAGSAADKVAAAGTAQVAAVEQLAAWLAFAVGAIPVLLALALYLPRRWRFVRTASAGQRFVDADEDLDLFALRALTRQPMHQLAAISHDPAGDWRRGDPLVVRRLAELELRSVGLRPPSWSPD